jgi:hypothetical protein
MVRPQVQSEVLIMPVGQKTREELHNWTSENHRLVLAYFDIFLRHGFDQKTRARVTVAEDGFEADSLEFSFEGMEGDNGPDWWSFVPLSGRVEHSGRYPDYVLIFDGLRFFIRSGAGARQTYDIPGGGRVEVHLEYILWDNQNQEVAAYGRLHQESQTSSPHPSSEIFKELFQKMAEEIVRNSPLS